MKKLGSILLILTLATIGSSLHAQEADTASPEQMMAEAMKFGMPGKHHKRLDVMEGEWNYTMKFRMTPDSPWSEGAGTANSNWILGGRFLQTTVQSPPSAAVPMEFEGLSILGYDNLKQEYLQLWMDNFMTQVMVLEGSADTTGKEITVSGEVTKPYPGAKPMDVRWVYRITSDDAFTFEMWEPDANGTEYLHGEISYTRAQ